MSCVEEAGTRCTTPGVQSPGEENMDVDLLAGGHAAGGPGGARPPLLMVRREITPSISVSASRSD